MHEDIHMHRKYLNNISELCLVCTPHFNVASRARYFSKYWGSNSPKIHFFGEQKKPVVTFHKQYNVFIKKSKNLSSYILVIILN